MNDIPVIKVELESLRQTMYHAFAQQSLQLDEMFKTALDEALDVETIQNKLNALAKQHLDIALAEAVKVFFQWNGEGYKSLKQAVELRLQQMFPE